MSEGRRVDLYDGLRGIAIVLVVLSHGWQLWPVEWIDSHAWVRPFFRNGNSGVTIFLVAAGFLMYRALTARRDLTQMRPDTAVVRRVARVGPALWTFLLVVVVVSALDPTDDKWHADTGASVFHVLTYTWNWYVQGNLITSRPDFGHLWYLSVDMQAFVVMAGFLYLLRRRPVGLLWALSAFYLVLLWWRFHVSQTEFIFEVLVRTTVRMDPFVVGVLVAAALPQLRRLQIPERTWSWTAAGALFALVPLLFWCDHDMSYLRWGGTFLEWDVALFFVAVGLGGTSGFLSRALGNRPLVVLGRASLAVYIWHYPVFMFVQRHSEARGWSWEVAASIGLLATAAVCVAADRLIEPGVATRLQSPRWRELDDGVLPWLARRGRRAASHAAERVSTLTGSR